MHAASAPNKADTDRRSRLLSRLTRYVLERFPVPAYGPLIVALVICGRSAGAVAVGLYPGLDWAVAATTVGVAAAFLQLRILDDVRDEGADRAGRPGRPLPRGLVTVAELRTLAAFTAAIGLVVAVPLGFAAAMSYVVAVAVIWFCGLDLPRRLPIRHDILTTALVHSVIAPLVLLFIWTTVAGFSGVGPLAATLVLVWGASLGVEIARKTLAPSEERPGVETYSAALGRSRAIMLVARALAVGLLGAGAFAAATGAPVVLAVAASLAAGTIPLFARQFGDRIGSNALQSGAVIVVLSTLLWPLIVSLVSR